MAFVSLALVAVDGRLSPLCLALVPVIVSWSEFVQDCLARLVFSCCIIPSVPLLQYLGFRDILLVFNSFSISFENLVQRTYWGKTLKEPERT